MKTYLRDGLIKEILMVYHRIILKGDTIPKLKKKINKNEVK